MPRQIRFNAFDMNCVGHIQQGLWAHPRDRSSDYTSLSYWMDYARRLEAGLFDGIFLADVVGIYDVLGGSYDAAVRGAVQVPVNDPMMLVPAMAAVTKHLAFGVTANLTYEQPFLFARRMSTLDHLTGGRIGWNIVTGYLDSAARAIGLDGQMAHDDRYDLADEYMDCLQALGSKLGRWRRIAGSRQPSLCRSGKGPSHRPSGQAIPNGCGASLRTVAAAHTGSLSGGLLAPRSAVCRNPCGMRVRQRPEEGRRERDRLRHPRAGSRRRSQSHDIKVFLGATIVTGRTNGEARDKFEDYKRFVSSEAALVHAAASMGIDFSKFDLDEPVETAGARLSPPTSRPWTARPDPSGPSASSWSRWCWVAASRR